MSIHIILFLLIIRVLWHVVCVVRYYKSAYRKCTHNRYLSVMRDAGKRGEYLLYKELKGFEKTGARFLFNTYLPHSYGRTTEVDVMMIHTTGVFVFENKNYGGLIFGDPDEDNWTQMFPKKHGNGPSKEYFFNPIKQNDIHIQSLKQVLSMERSIYSVIVFGDRCELKNISEKITQYYTLCRTYSVKKNVSRIAAIEECVIKQEQVEEIYNKLYPYSQVSKKVKRKHIYNI